MTLARLLSWFKAPAPPAEPICPVLAALKAKRAIKSARHERVSDIDAAIQRRTHAALWAGMGMTER